METKSVIIEGGIYPSNNYGEFKVIRYMSYKEVVVMFINTGFKTTTTVSNIRDGKIKDYLLPVVEGVGFRGIGKYNSKENGVIHSTWRSMLNRCYNSGSLARRPTYKGCTVCSEWHDFQNFAKWYEVNYKDGLHLDKDIKMQGNREYSPETCSFVTPQLNAEKAIAKDYKFTSPDGVVTDIYNLRKFCKDNNLNRGCMGMVLKGIRRHHKGWTLTK